MTEPLRRAVTPFRVGFALAVPSGRDVRAISRRDRAQALQSLLEGGSRMHVLRIEHPVHDFDSWKTAFDSDPIERKMMGVRRYQVYRPTDDRKYALSDLEFDSEPEAEACLIALRKLWSRVQGSVVNDPQVRILALVEEKQLSP